MTQPEPKFHIKTPICVTSEGELVTLSVKIFEKDNLIDYDTFKSVSGHTLSISGNSKGMSGQIRKELLEDLEQNPESFESRLSHDEIRQLLTLWEEHHLNDLIPYSKHQEPAVKEVYSKNPNASHEDIKQAINKLELPENLYQYGSKWLYKPIPLGALNQIQELMHKAAHLHQKNNLKGNYEKLLEAFDVKMKSSFKSTANTATHSASSKQRNYECIITTANPFTGKQHSFTTPFFQGSGIDHDPTLDDVLECLVSDAVSVDQAPTFKEWAEDMGYELEDMDDWEKVKVNDAYKGCKREHSALNNLFGKEGAEALKYDEWETIFKTLEELKQEHELDSDSPSP